LTAAETTQPQSSVFFKRAARLWVISRETLEAGLLPCLSQRRWSFWVWALCGSCFVRGAEIDPTRRAFQLAPRIDNGKSYLRFLEQRAASTARSNF
jgi:hypothetical protein